MKELKQEGLKESLSTSTNTAMKSMPAGSENDDNDNPNNDDSGTADEELVLVARRTPNSLILLWWVIAGELCFDMSATIISFLSLTAGGECCDTPIPLGVLPLTITTMLFLMVWAEVALLIRCVWLTRRSSENQRTTDSCEGMGETVVDEEDPEVLAGRRSKEVGRKNMKFLGLLVSLNPILGCLIAWFLLDRSYYRHAFIALGLEGLALLLRYFSIYLQGGIHSCSGFILYGLFPLVPFAIVIGLYFSVFLKQGGVCYLVEDQAFKFNNACGVCADGYPPVDGVCYFPNGTATYNFYEEESSPYYQASYCAVQNPEGPQDTNFCFFDYDYGKLDGIVPLPNYYEETVVPTP